MMKRTVLFLATFIVVLAIGAQLPSSQKHEVQSGETLYSIARHYEISVAALLQSNPGLQAEHMMAGQTIVIPAQTQETISEPNEPTNSPTQKLKERPKYKTTHEVKRKETVYSVSRLYGISETQLLEANPEIKKKVNVAKKLLRQHRVNFIAPADYTKESRAYQLVCAIIDKIKADWELAQLNK